MSDTPAAAADPAVDDAPDMKLFWACFIALIATAFGFIIRAFLMGTWADEFGFTETQKGEIFGVGLWPFAISIVLFSLVIDRIGYGVAMVFAFVAHCASAALTIAVPFLVGEGENVDSNLAYWLLYAANFIVALGNGTIEAVVNPVVATMFRRDKTKWLNILHAGWPGGLVLAGAITILMGDDINWQYKVALMFLPVIAYGVLMLGAKFPVSERVSSGVSYKEMLREFGMGGALIVSYLMFTEISRVFGIPPVVTWIAIAVATIGFGAAVGFALGRPLFLLLLLIMVPLASTELGVDSWIEELMKKPVEQDLGIKSGWVLVYTSLIMMVLRFFAGPIVHKISPLGLLAVSSVLAIIGLFSLSAATGVAILLAATIYAFGKTFFWPTMLGVVAEQFPRGGALTLNAAGGVGMLGVGVVGAQILGYWVDKGVGEEYAATYPEAAAEVVVEQPWAFGSVETVSADALEARPAAEQAFIETATEDEKKETLATVTIFPMIMLACYLGLIAYFKTRGGYQAEVITSDDGTIEQVVEHTPADPVPAGASEEQFTGGVEGPAGK